MKMIIYKKFKKTSLVSLLGICLIVFSIAIFVLLTMSDLPQIRLWYEQYLNQLTNLELKIANFDDKWIVLLSIFFLFSLKSVLPVSLIPVSCICVISGMVFTMPVSLTINIVGVCLLFSIRYFMGRNKKSLPYRILKKHGEMRKLLEQDSGTNPWILFVCRLFPLVPINTVSNIYGNMKFEFKKYLLISVSGFLPRIISYLIIGHNVFNPFSASFLVPIMILSFLSGVGVLLTKRIILIIKRKGERNVKN